MEVASRRAKARCAAAIAFIGCVFVGGCAGWTERPSEVTTTPVYRTGGSVAPRTEIRQEVPKVQTIRMGEESFQQP